MPKHHTWNPTPGKLYLKLTHGRMDPLEEMEERGFDGGYLGPLEYVHTTYGSLVRLGLKDEEIHLTLRGDLLPFNGALYGDWTTAVITGDAL